MSTEQQPLLGEVSVGTHLNSRAHTVGAMGLELSVNGTIPQTQCLRPHTDKLPSYTESTGHIVLSMNIPAPPPYTYAGQVTTRTESNREYPAGQIFAFGLCMLISAAILYAYKHIN